MRALWLRLVLLTAESFRGWSAGPEEQQWHFEIIPDNLATFWTPFEVAHDLLSIDLESCL